MTTAAAATVPISNQPTQDNLRVARQRVEEQEAADERNKEDPVSPKYRYASELVKDGMSDTLQHLDQHILDLRERRDLLDAAIANAEATRDQYARARAALPARPARF